MFFNPYEAQMVMEERVKDAMREAEQERLIRMAKSARPGLLDGLLASIGGLLISAGKKLQARHAPLQSALAASPSPCKPMTKPC